MYKILGTGLFFLKLRTISNFASSRKVIGNYKFTLKKKKKKIQFNVIEGTVNLRVFPI